MTELLRQLLIAGAGGAGAALAAWGICAMLRRARAPGWLLCLLWLAVGLRFAIPGGLVPVTLPQPESEPLQQLAAAAETVRESPSGQAVSQAAQALDAAGLELTAAGETTLAFDWALAAGVIWAAGAVFCLGRAGLAGVRLRRRVALACKTEDGCYTCAQVTAPFTLGLVRPRIYLPADLQGEARRAVLLHERTHIRRGDCLTKPLYYLVVCLHWWNPLAWLAFSQFEHAMECACDEAALRGCTAAQRSLYCESLLRYATRRIPGGALAFGAPGTGQRILHALRYRAPGKVMLGVCVAVAALTAAVFLARPTLAQEAAAGAAQATVQGIAQEPTTAAGAPASDESLETDQGLYTASGVANDGVFDPAGAFIVPLEEYRYYSRQMSYYHKGDDLAAEAGTPVLASAGGVVTTAQFHYSYGKMVIIDHGTDADGRHWYTLYAHLKDVLVEEGQTVAQGEQIGTVGSTGNTTGNALHFELRCDDTLLAPTMYLPYTETVPALAAEQGVLLDAMLGDPAIANAIARRAIGILAPDTLDYPLPEKQEVTCEYMLGGHSGLDLRVEEGTDVLAAADGIVLFAGWDDIHGWTVILGHGNDNSDRPLLTMYSHLKSKPDLLMGQLVTAGQVIAQSGSTGNSTGPHLHFAVYLDGTTVDPQAWLN